MNDDLYIGAPSETPIPRRAKTRSGFKKQYKALVWRLTEKNAHKVKDIHKRSFKDFHIDHIISIHYGFLHNLTPSFISSSENLRVIPAKNNLSKGSTLTPEAIKLLTKYNLY
jgi:hypothetical protein